MKKVPLISIGVLLVCIAAIYVTVLFNRDSSTMSNEFGVGYYRTLSTEQFTSPDNWKPCDETEKTFVVKNEGTIGVKVRLSYSEIWRNASDTRNLPLDKDGVRLANIVFQNQDDWELKSDGYYYYKTTLAPNATTSSLFQKVVLNCEADFGADNTCTETGSGVICEKAEDEYEAAKYHLKITSQTIQEDAANSEWSYAFLDTGMRFNAALKSLVGSGSFYTSWDSYIHSISFVNELPDSIGADAKRRAVSASGTNPAVYAYDDGDHNIYIYSSAKTIYANANCQYMFNAMYELQSISFGDSFDTSKVTDMSYMFYRLHVASLVLPDSFDTSSVNNMDSMFMNAGNMTSLTLSRTFNTANVANMASMFKSMSSLSILTLPNAFETSNVKDMNGMFSHMSSMASLYFSNSFYTTSVLSTYGMFYGSAFTTLTLPSTFDTTRASDTRVMFADMPNLRELTLPPTLVPSSNTDSQIFRSASSSATLNSSAAPSIKALWPGQFRDD